MSLILAEIAERGSSNRIIGNAIEVHKTSLKELTLGYKADVKIFRDILSGFERIVDIERILTTDYLDRVKSQDPETDIELDETIYHLNDGLKVTIKRNRSFFNEYLDLLVEGEPYKIKEFAGNLAKMYPGKIHLNLEEV